jgi:hypothetical protein
VPVLLILVNVALSRREGFDANAGSHSVAA